MPDLESLKAEHPEWCWNCEEMRAHRQPCAFRPHPVISALTAAKLEDEATIAELEEHKTKLREVAMDAISKGAADRPFFEVFFDDDDFEHFYTIRQAHQLNAVDLRAALAERDSIQSQLSAEQAAHAATKEELRKADEALVVATEVAQDMRGYCRGWDWKYGEEWDAALTASEQRMAPALARIQAQRAADAAKEE